MDSVSRSSDADYCSKTLCKWILHHVGPLKKQNSDTQKWAMVKCFDLNDEDDEDEDEDVDQAPVHGDVAQVGAPRGVLEGLLPIVCEALLQTHTHTKRTSVTAQRQPEAPRDPRTR